MSYMKRIQNMFSNKKGNSLEGNFQNRVSMVMFDDLNIIILK